MIMIDITINIIDIRTATIRRTIPTLTLPKNGSILLLQEQEMIMLTEMVIMGIIIAIIIIAIIVKVEMVMITNIVKMKSNWKKGKCCKYVNDNLRHNAHNFLFINIERKYVI